MNGSYAIKHGSGTRYFVVVCTVSKVDAIAGHILRVMQTLAVFCKDAMGNISSFSIFQFSCECSFATKLSLQPKAVVVDFFNYTLFSFTYITTVIWNTLRINLTPRLPHATLQQILHPTFHPTHSLNDSQFKLEYQIDVLSRCSFSSIVFLLHKILHLYYK